MADNLKKYLGNEKGAGGYITGFIAIVCILVVFSNVERVQGYISNLQKLDRAASASITMLQYDGGVSTRVIDAVSSQLQNEGVDPSLITWEGAPEGTVNYGNKVYLKLSATYLFKMTLFGDSFTVTTIELPLQSYVSAGSLYIPES